jgi:dTMP kinase
MRGIFIVIEGLDGSGGTTQCGRLTDWLRAEGAIEVLQTAEPTDLPVGAFIRRALKRSTEEGRLGDEVLPYLFAADRQDHLDRRVHPALLRGAVVISDRYLHSSLAYQSLSLEFEQVAALNANFRIPDLTIMLDLAPEICLERISSRGGELERFETLQRLQAIATAYERVEAWCLARGERFERVEADSSPDDIAQRIQRRVQTLWSGR